MSFPSLLTANFLRFIHSQKFSGVLLMTATVISLLIANSQWSDAYHDFWSEHVHAFVFGNSLSVSPEHFVNEILMSVFFLLVGLEIKREFLDGELSGREKALLPIGAALGGMIFPAMIYALFNSGTPTSSGWGIPMATDIAFAIGIMSILGNRVPDALKILLTAIAVVDDLGAVLVIAIFYTSTLSFAYLAAAAGVLLVLYIFNRLKINILLPYILGGIALWICIYNSGIHSTIAGVLLAMMIPYGKGDASPLCKLENNLHGTVNYLIMPVFALANTAITIQSGFTSKLLSPESLGIAGGLIIGKPLGISLFIWIMVKLRWSKLPEFVDMKEIVAVGFLGGIGFTMSIFISLLAFTDSELITTAKLMVLVSSLIAGLTGYLLLKKYADAKS